MSRHSYVNVVSQQLPATAPNTITGQFATVNGVGNSASLQNSSTLANAIGGLYLFFLFSHSIEFIDVTGRLHLIVVLAVLALFAALAGGKLGYSFTSKPGLALSFFTALLILGIPFSSWAGGSFRSFADLWWKSYLTFFLVSGLIFTVAQVRRAMFLIAVASLGIVYITLQATRGYDDGRISVEYGSLGNSNDLAGALLMCLPFVMYVVLDKTRVAVIRLGFLGVVGLMLATILKTGSRSSLIVIALMAAILFLKAKAADKAKIFIVVAICLCAFPFFVSKALIERYATMFTSQVTSGMSDAAASAVLSTNARAQLQKNAVTLTIHHPIFGVGLGNFSFQSANLQIARGDEALWYTCHNIFLLVSSETGVLGFAFYMATIIFAMKILLRIGKAAKQTPELQGVSEMAFAIFMGLIAFAAAGFFGTNAYNMQMPAMVGLAVALDRLTKPALARAEELRMSKFRQAIPVTPSRFAGAAASALTFR
jgi:O-antigen ligase